AEDVAQDFGLNIAASRDAGAVADFGRVVTDQVVANISPRAGQEGDASPLIGDLLAEPFSNRGLERLIADDDVVDDRRRAAVADDAPAVGLLLSAGNDKPGEAGLVGPNRHPTLPL